jgi:hypothetical protein
VEHYNAITCYYALKLYAAVVGDWSRLVPVPCASPCMLQRRPPPRRLVPERVQVRGNPRTRKARSKPKKGPFSGSSIIHASVPSLPRLCWATFPFSQDHRFPSGPELYARFEHPSRLSDIKPKHQFLPTTLSPVFNLHQTPSFPKHG